MKRLILLLIGVFAFSNTAIAQKWSLDKAHSTVKFEVEHIVVLQKVMDTPEDYYTMGTTDGSFKDFDIKFTLGNDDFSGSQIEATIKVNSVDTDNDGRDGHLKSEDFFDAEKFPAITFKSKEFIKTGEKSYKITGDITIKGVTRTVEFDATCTSEFAKASESDFISFTATGKIDRYKFGLKWTDLIEQGGFRVSSYVQLKIQANLMKNGSSYVNEKYD